MVWQARRGDAGGSIRDPPPCVGRGVRPRRLQVPATTIAAARVFNAAMIDSTQTPGTRTHSDPRAAATSAAGAATVRSRFAPSPTGMLHIGGARTALFAWAFARHFGGRFILRIEDTDVARSTPEAVQAIFDGLQWLGLEADEGPFYQMQRMGRYREVLETMLAAGTAYHCYASPAELDALREAQRARGEKPRYDGRWRPERAVGRQPPPGVDPVIRFRNPDDGSVGWDDLVKGPIAIANAELDDLVIARPDGTPTYNFCVVVDDRDMQITHVIRGDDHVNNTPRQINILRALGAEVPRYGHLPMIHGPDGQKLSKRHGAVSVLEYQRAGYLPEAVVNYLARLGWSHGDDEVFDRETLVRWFDGSHLSESPSQLDFGKLRWLNQQYLKAADDRWLANAVAPRLTARVAGPSVAAVAAAGGPAAATTAAAGPAAPGAAAAPSVAIDPRELEPSRLWPKIALLKERAATLEDLADELAMLVLPAVPDPDRLAARLDDSTRAAIRGLVERLATIDDDHWEKTPIAEAIKATLATTGLKMPALAIPVRLVVFGREQTPSLDAMLALLGRSATLERLAAIGSNSPLCAGE